MAILNVMSGVPGSGKSTYIARHKGPADAVISRDVVRKTVASKYNSDDPYFLHEAQVYREFVRQIDEAGLSYDTVWADATHLNYKSLNKLFCNINTREFDKIRVICIEASLKTCLKQNAQRFGKARVPDADIIRMWQAYSRPNLNDYPNINMELQIIKLD